MKTQFNRIKTGAQSMSHRTIAMILCFVMLISAIGAGSVLTAIAQEFEPSGESVLAAAALSGADVTIPEDEEAETDKAADSSDDAAEAEDNDTAGKNLVDDLIARLRADKEDLAAVGAEADLAASGAETWTNYYLHYSIDNGTWQNVYFNAAGTASITFSGKIQFEFLNNGTVYKKDSSQSDMNAASMANSGNRYAKKNGNGNWIVESVTSGTYTFTLYDLSGDDLRFSVSSSGGSTAETWTVTGSSATIFGAAWAQDSSANDMTLVSENTYVKVFTGVTDVSNFSFKINKDHAWTTAYPSSNFVVTHVTNTSTRSITATTDSSGDLYWKSGDTLTFTFNSSDHKISITSETPETTHDVSFSAGSNGSISPPAGTHAVGEVTETTVTASPNTGYTVDSWTIGNGITVTEGATTGTSQSNTIKIKTKASGTYTVSVTFKKQSYTLTKGTVSPTGSGTFDISPTTGSSVEYQSTVTVNCTPGNGYQLGAVKYVVGGTTYTASSGSGNTRTFSMPAGATTVNVEFSKISYSITKVASPTAGGTVTTGTSSGSTTATTYQIGNTLYIKATANAAYTLTSVVVTYGDGTAAYTKSDAVSGTEFSVSMASHYGNITVTANFTAKPTYPITVTSSNAAYGTASSSPAYAYEGQTVTLTAVDDAGTFQYWSGTSSLTITEGTVGDTDTAGSKTLKFTMPSSAVKIKAHFNAYTPTASNYYYNNYDSTTGAVTYGNQMTKAMISGHEFSYYHVEGRTEVNQTFTVSLGNMNYNGSVYMGMQIPNNDSDHWDNGKTDEQFVRFMATDGNEIVDYKHLNHHSSLNDDGAHKVGFQYAIPNGARWAQVKCGSKNNYTVHIDLSTAQNGGNNVFYIDGGKSGTNWTVTGWNRGGNLTGDVYEYIGQAEKYVSAYNTVGFNSINDFQILVDGSKEDGHVVCYPNQNLSSYGDYYILVLEPNTSYTINGVTRTTGSTVEIIWMKELPVADNDSIVKVYAKDGAVRATSGSTTYTTYAAMADTVINDSDDDHVGTPVEVNTNCGYETYTATKGETITIKTTINNNYGVTTSPAQKYSDQYYVRGFLVNGEVPKGTLNTSGLSGGTVVTGGVEYTLEYTIPEDFDGKYIEITPVYYLADTSTNQTVTFYVENFTPELQALSDNGPNWGNTIYAYPFYGTLSSTNNAFGQYPGQPLIFYNGTYSIQIPIYDTSPFPIYTGSPDNTILTSGTDSGKLTQRRAIRISGITLHNGYYDTVHRTVMEYKHNGDGGSYQYRYQTQTYDFDDFYKIYHEKDDVDNIVFQFKYKEYSANTDNLYLLDGFTPSDAASITSRFGADDFEDLLNFHKRKVNIYGDALSGSALSNNPLYVVSKAGGSSVENTVGHYATEWVIYKPSAKTGTATYSKVEVDGGKSSIPPSLLLLNSDESFSNTMYPSAVSGYNTTDWKAYYNLLANYKDCPVKITYEEAKYDVSGDKATRSDGRWLYSKNGDNITSNIRIDVNTSDSGGTYVNNTTANISGLSAYFTNPEAEGQMTYATTIDPDKTFNYTAATSNPDYIFEGWYLDNGTRITKDFSGETERTGNYTFVARFRHHTSGILMLNHSRGTDDNNYKGNGATKMTVTVVDGDGVIVRKDENVSEVTLPESIIKTDNSAYTIKVTLTATPSGDDKFEKVILSEKNADGTTNSNITGTFFDGSLTYTTMPGEFTFTVGDLFADNTQVVKLLSYKSYFSAPVYTYQIMYQYTSKLLDDEGKGATQYFTRKGTMTSAEGSAYVTKDGSGNRILSPEFINSKAPCEENFGEKKVWTIPESTYRTFTEVSSNNYSIEMISGDAIVTSVASSSADTRSITYELPYLYDGTGNAKFEETGSASAYAQGSDPYLTTSKNYVLTVPYGKVAKPRYNTLSDKMVTRKATVPEAEDDLYVVAPDTLNASAEDATKYYFQYWRVYSNKDSEEVARCYTTKFTFAALGDYTITPIYQTEQTENPLTGMAATISYLGPSRNQWNYNGYGNAVMIENDAEAKVASDLIFEDFVCAYYYHGEKIYTGENTDLQTGYVVERIGYLDAFDGKVVTNTNRKTVLTKSNTNTQIEYYEDKYSAYNENAVKNAIDLGAGTHSNYSVVNFNSTSLDNKDRIQNFYSVYNSVGWVEGDETPQRNAAYKYFVYRAFSYIKDSSTGDIELSEPVYFIMYDIATK